MSSFTPHPTNDDDDDAETGTSTTTTDQQTSLLSGSYQKHPPPKRPLSMEVLEENQHQNIRKREWTMMVVVACLNFVLGAGLVSLFRNGTVAKQHSEVLTPNDNTVVNDTSGDETVIVSTTNESSTTTTPAAPSCPNTDPILSLKNESSLSNLLHGAIATDHPLCSQIASRILQNGGNAIDASITAALCLGVANPASSGMGGGAFILLHTTNTTNTNATTTTELIDCRETAPLASSQNMFEQLPLRASVEGGLSVGILGELKGLELAHRRHGVLPWFDVVDPVIEIARDGIEVSKYLAKEIREVEDKLWRNPTLAQLLTKDHDGKRLLEAGDVLKQPILADTLTKIRDEGADVLYKGPLAEALVREVNDAGGIWSLEDLEHYEAVIRDPIISPNDVFGFSIVGAPPPSSGGAAIIGAARFLSGYDDTPFSTFKDTLSQHRLVEAMKHVFAIRMSLSDPSFDDGNTTAEAVQDMIQGEYMDTLRRMTRDDTVLPLSKYGGEKWAQIKDPTNGNRRKRRKLRLFQYLEDRGTAHLSVIDKDRNAVALTSTVNTVFGSGLVSPSTGIVLNNEMDDFASPGRDNFFGLEPNPANYISPNKRPLSSMSPTLIFHPDPSSSSSSPLGKLYLSVGASGGPRIITSTLITFLNYAVLGMDLFQAVSHPRLHDQLLYDDKPLVLVDRDPLVQGPVIELSHKTKDALKKRGHELFSKDYLGTVQAVAVDLETEVLEAVSDVRKDGAPAGY